MNLSEIEVEKLKQNANRYKGSFADAGHVNSSRAPSAYRYARFGCSLIRRKLATHDVGLRTTAQAIVLLPSCMQTKLC